MRGLGHGIKEFKKASSEIESEITKPLKEEEQKKS